MQTLLLIGCGSMGSALLHGWIGANLDREFDIHIIDPSPHGTDAGTGKFGLYPTLEETPAELKPDILFFAIKPQLMADALPAYAKRYAGAKPLIISIAAGKTIESFTRHFGQFARVVRTMPNTPAMIGEGVSVLTPSGACSENEIALAEKLMRGAGHVEVLEDESLMDAVTAISGSGPAYVFYFMEALAQAGVEAGLPKPMAEALAARTVRGAALLQTEKNAPFDELRKAVTSPGGTTEAALNVLMDDNSGLKPLVKKAADAAIARSKELATN